MSDAVLAEVRGGARQAWETVYHAYASPLFGYLMIRLRDREEASEALSETWLRALENVSSYRGDAGGLKTWLFTIARNISIDRGRRGRKLMLVADIDDEIDVRHGDPDDRLIASQDKAAVLSAMDTLPAPDRELLWLRVGQGLSSAEVGRIMGKAAGAVRMQQLRALRALAEAMGR